MRRPLRPVDDPQPPEREPDLVAQNRSELDGLTSGRELTFLASACVRARTSLCSGKSLKWRNLLNSGAIRYGYAT